MSGYFLKDPNSELELSVDWRAGYLQQGERVSDDLGWSIRPVEDVPDELRVVLQECGAARSTATFEGGIPGRIYMVSSRILTTLGRELERTLMFRVKERELP
ncbi:MAG: hypothetical protein JKY41_01095 [Rhodobacteraceae bacterium]|nr:hypothetical protein [Paracoccaceae bacterium]